jgi:hypothetical protein
MTTWETIRLLKEARTSMSGAVLSLLFLPQQILLPDALDCGWRQDVVNAMRQERHYL